MSSGKAKLESKFIYRLVKVLYIFVFLTISAIVILIGWSSRPVPTIDGNRSIISCANGPDVSFNTAGIHASLSELHEFDSYNDTKAREYCKQVKTYTIRNRLTGETKEIKYSERAKYNIDEGLDEPKLNEINYSINPVKVYDDGSWTAALRWWFLGLAGTYVVLNLLRETLNYVFLGKPFDWDWLHSIFPKR